MIKILQDGIGYVVLIYTDSSKRIIRTTINAKILLENNAIYKEGHLYDLDHKEQVPYTQQNHVEVYKERPELEGVDWFVNKFI